MLHSGLKTLICYAPEVSQWKQAHARARFAIVRACLIWSRGAVTISKKGDEVVIRIDPAKLQGVVDATEILLKHLTYFKTARLPDAAKGDSYRLARIGGEKVTILDVIHAAIDTTQLALE